MLLVTLRVLRILRLKPALEDGQDEVVHGEPAYPMEFNPHLTKGGVGKVIVTAVNNGSMSLNGGRSHRHGRSHGTSNGASRSAKTMDGGSGLMAPPSHVAPTPQIDDDSNHI